MWLGPSMQSSHEATPQEAVGEESRHDYSGLVPGSIPMHPEIRGEKQNEKYIGWVESETEDSLK